VTDQGRETLPLLIQRVGWSGDKPLAYR